MNKLVVFFVVVAAVAEASYVGGPIAYHSALLGPAAVSHQSRVDVHSSPLIHGYHGIHGIHAPLAYSAPLVHGAAIGALPPHHPATILTPHGVPLDTIDVVAARAQHFQAKALASHGLHYLKKRSLLADPLAYSALAYSGYGSPLLSHHHLPLAYGAPALVAPHGQLALGPHQPATVLSPRGVPLDTIDVVNARAAHYQAKALAGHDALVSGWY